MFMLLVLSGAELESIEPLGTKVGILAVFWSF